MINSQQNKQQQFIRIMSAALLLSYAFRVTIVGNWIPAVIVNYASFVIAFFVSVLLIFSSRRSVDFVSLMLVFLLLMTSLFSIASSTAFVRYVLWLLVFCSTASLIQSPKATELRFYLWNDHRFIIYCITVLSFIWYILGMPMYGKGISGITGHCMLLSAIAGISAILSFSNILLNKKSVLYWGIFVSSLLTCLLGSSRTAFAAAIGGCVIAVCMQLNNVKNTIISIGIILLMATVLSVLFDDTGSSNQFTAGLKAKGEHNSRERLWETRFEEFSENMLFGVGMGVDSSAEDVGEANAKAVEPGSSYLAILSMTGLLGAFGLLLLFFNLASRLIVNIAAISTKDLTECLAVGVFWFVHAIAEGWIFAGGSLLCLFFWIWVGRCFSLGTKVSKNLRRAVS